MKQGPGSAPRWRIWPSSRSLSIPKRINMQWGATAVLASRTRLTLYDAAYLELAQRRRLPLASLDRELRAAATAEGVPPLLGVHS